MIPIGERLKTLRVAQNYSQEQFADILSTNYHKLSRLENGKTEISIDILRLLGMNYGPEKLYWLVTGFELPEQSSNQGPAFSIKQIDTDFGYVPAFIGQDGTQWAIKVDEWDRYLSKHLDTEYLLGMEKIGFSNAFGGRAYRAFSMDHQTAGYFNPGDRTLCGSVMNLDQLHPAGIYILINKKKDVLVGRVKAYTDGALMIYQENSGKSADVMVEDIVELWEVLNVITTPGFCVSKENITVDNILQRLAALEASIKR